MLGGLARWLRAAGYDAEFSYGIDDHELILRALRTGAILLSSDGGLFERNVIRHKTVRALQVPREMGKARQLEFVLAELGLPVRAESRCMACGGQLAEIDKADAAAEAPPKAFEAHERFWRCLRCGKLLWRGTHWRKIAAVLERIGERDGSDRGN